jgi:peroxiredoxin
MIGKWIRSLLILSLQLLLLSLPPSSLQALSSGEEIPPQIFVGQKIPNCNLLDMEVALEHCATQLYTLLQDASKTVLIFYRGYWSPDCRRQFADLRARFSEFQEKGAQIVGVSVDEPLRVAEFGRNLEKEYLLQANRYAEGQPIKLPLHLVSDSTREATRKLGIGEEDPRLGLIARPTTILLDQEGTIHWLYIGKSPNDRPSADEILRGLTW